MSLSDHESRSRNSSEHKMKLIHKVNCILISLSTDNEFHEMLQGQIVNKALLHWMGTESISKTEEDDMNNNEAVQSVLNKLQHFQDSCQAAGISGAVPNTQMINGIKKRIPQLPDAFMKIYLGTSFEEYKKRQGSFDNYSSSDEILALDAKMKESDSIEVITAEGRNTIDIESVLTDGKILLPAKDTQSQGNMAPNPSDRRPHSEELTSLTGEDNEIISFFAKLEAQTHSLNGADDGLLVAGTVASPSAIAVTNQGMFGGQNPANLFSGTIDDGSDDNTIANPITHPSASAPGPLPPPLPLPDTPLNAMINLDSRLSASPTSGREKAGTRELLVETPTTAAITGKGGAAIGLVRSGSVGEVREERGRVSVAVEVLSVQQKTIEHLSFLVSTLQQRVNQLESRLADTERRQETQQRLQQTNIPLQYRDRRDNSSSNGGSGVGEGSHHMAQPDEDAQKELFRRWILEYEQQKQALAANSALNDAERRLPRCIELSILSPEMKFSNGVLSTAVSLGDTSEIDEESDCQMAIGSQPLSLSAPSYWTVTIQAIIGDDLCIGVTGATVLRSQLHKDPTTVAWSSSDSDVFVCGNRMRAFGGWDGSWQANDKAVFKFDPIPPRSISFHHSRLNQVFCVDNLPPNEYRVFARLLNSTGVILFQSATLEEKFLISLFEEV